MGRNEERKSLSDSGPGKIRLIIIYLGIIAACIVLAGCGRGEPIGDGFTLVTQQTISPDAYPGTSLHRKGKVVWGNVYVGFFSPNDPKAFYHDGIFLFVGPVPGNSDWWTRSQLFAVHGGGSPVVLSERLTGEELVVSPDGRYESTFAVQHITPTNGGFHVEFEHARDCDVSWDEIKKMLDEADSSSKIVLHSLGNYRVLPKRQRLKQPRN